MVLGQANSQVSEVMVPSLEGVSPFVFSCPMDYGHILVDLCKHIRKELRACITELLLEWKIELIQKIGSYVLEDGPCQRPRCEHGSSVEKIHPPIAASFGNWHFGQNSVGLILIECQIFRDHKRGEKFKWISKPDQFVELVLWYWAEVFHNFRSFLFRGIPFPSHWSMSLPGTEEDSQNRKEPLPEVKFLSHHSKSSSAISNSQEMIFFTTCSTSS